VKKEPGGAKKHRQYRLTYLDLSDRRLQDHERIEGCDLPLSAHICGGDRSDGCRL
jgi:hypothetical protein